MPMRDEEDKTREPANPLLEDERIDLGLVDHIEAEAIGEPGQRTFKISAGSPRGEATLWMEKEQLFQIGLAIKQFASTVERPGSPRPYEAEYPAPPNPAVTEFKASELRVRHDRDSDVFTIEAADPDSEAEDDDEEPAIAIQFSFTRGVGEDLAEEALKAVAAGRPRCDLCGGPKDPAGHVCPKTNGHHRGNFELA